MTKTKSDNYYIFARIVNSERWTRMERGCRRSHGQKCSRVEGDKSSRYEINMNKFDLHYIIVIIIIHTTVKCTYIYKVEETIE